jgi:nitrous oxidase accessory protein NosD
LEYAQSRVRTSAGGFSSDAPRSHVARVSALIVSLAIAAPAPARAMNTCTNPISACPCSIRSAGDYTVSGPGLIANPPGDCIHINVPGVTLDLASTTLSSSPSTTADVGVYVLATATGAVVRGTLNAAATVSGFTTGIQIDAAGVTLENVIAQTNGVGIKINGGSAYGSALAVHDSSRTAS